MAEPTPTDTPTLSAVPSAVVSAVGTPQSLPPMDAEEREKSIKVSLADLTAKAGSLYVQKKYDEASEVFAQAAEMQAEFNGEMSPDNADILYLYGRCLFKVGQSKSDVLGGKAGTEKKKPKAANGAAKSKTAAAEASTAMPLDDIKEEEQKTDAEKVAEEGVAIVAKNASGSGLEGGDKVPEEKKPLFQFTGDENFEGSDEEEDAEEEGEGEEEEEEDDLAVAFEVLDLARVMFEKQLEQGDADAAESKGKEKADDSTPSSRHVQERLADTHDLLAEISLENEKFPLAVNDTRASLKYKSALYPEESEVIAEAHFKLSLALEFASITTDSQDEEGQGPKALDEEMRNEAVSELEKAIASTRMKLQNEEVDLATIHAPEENEASRKRILEVKDIIADMEQRLVDLKNPVDVEGALGAENPMTGLLGAALGESKAETEARIQEAKKNANDLSGLVRKKEKKAEDDVEAAESNGKRKAEEPALGVEEVKRAKTEEPQPAET
ncbi:hypothetical protein PG993_001852 [Apiospora rasikravindrae]|uniref:Tetratricopeptide SHNi-TPR domain-containing protein n=1 Tax=Apiospora rasikravindrae TaxID=990691 RepID=A0ABR1UCP2_9PEZI